MDFISVEIPSEKDNEKILRINLQNEEDALRWFKNHEETTKSKYVVVDRMSPQPKRYIFHKKWACQLSHIYKKKKSNRNLSCPASIDILIKKVTFSTKRNDTFLRREPPLQGLLKITGHNHPVESCESLGLLRISSHTRELFYEYFNNGHGPCEAMRMHESKLILTDNSSEIVNASINPKPRTIYHLYDCWRTSDNGKSWLESLPIQMLKTKVESYKAEGTNVIINEDGATKWCVIVVSSIMRRAHNIEEAKEIIFIDSTVFNDKDQSVINVVLTATKCGVVPLAVLLQNKKDEQGYEEAFKLLKRHYPVCFGGEEAPQIFITDDSTPMKAALRKTWPTASQYLSHFIMGLQEWRWLCDTKKNISYTERLSLISKFLSLMYAVSTEAFESALSVLKCCGNDKYVARIEKLLEFKEEWATLFRVDMFIRGHETKNFAEASIRILKDIILCRTKAYNVCSLVYFSTHVWEEYFCRSLLFYAYRKEATSELIYNKLCRKLNPDLANEVQREGEYCFIVPSSKIGKASYKVNILIGWCSCFAGSHGAFCKHQTLVFEVFGVGFPKCPTISNLDKPQLGMLAMGDMCPTFEYCVDSEEVVTHETIVVIHQPNEAESLEKEDQHFPNSTQSSRESQKEAGNDVDKVFEEAVAELLRLHVLAQKADSTVYLKTLKKFIAKLRLTSTPNQALQTFQYFNVTNFDKPTNDSIIILNDLFSMNPSAISETRENKPRNAAEILVDNPNKEPLTKKSKRV